MNDCPCKHSLEDYVWVGTWTTQHKKVLTCLICGTTVTDENSNGMPVLYK